MFKVIDKEIAELIVDKDLSEYKQRGYIFYLIDKDLSNFCRDNDWWRDFLEEIFLVSANINKKCAVLVSGDYSSTENFYKAYELEEAKVIEYQYEVFLERDGVDTLFVSIYHIRGVGYILKNCFYEEGGISAFEVIQKFYGVPESKVKLFDKIPLKEV